MSVALGWSAIVLIALGLAGVIFGYWDMERQTVADGKMGGAMLVMFALLPLGLGAVLGLIWLAVT